MNSCVLLAAGLSERFHSPKALAKINDLTVIEHIQTTLLSTQIDEIIVVLGAHQDDIKPLILNHNRLTVVYNKDYKFGQTSSFQTGLKAVSKDSKSVFLLPVDCPFIKAETFDHLLHIFSKGQASILVPAYNSQKGHPPVFSPAVFNEIINLDHSLGINSIVQKHKSDELIFEVDDPGVLATFNTQEEFEELISSGIIY